MRKSNFYGVDVPELGDRADITVVSQAIIDGEGNQSGRVEHLKATNSGTTLILSSETREAKLIKYYNGLSIQFVSPVNIAAGNSYKIKIDNLAEQPYNNKTDIKAGDIVQAYYGASGFVSSNTPIPRSSSTSSSSEVTVATSLAVKNANDNANTRALKTTQIIAGNGLIGGGDLSGNRTINVVSADDSITVGVDNIKVNTYDGLGNTSSTRPVSARVAKKLQDEKMPYTGGTFTGDVSMADGKVVVGAYNCGYKLYTQDKTSVFALLVQPDGYLHLGHNNSMPIKLDSQNITVNGGFATTAQDLRGAIKELNDGKLAKSGGQMTGSLEMTGANSFIGAHNWGYTLKNKLGNQEYLGYIDASGTKGSLTIAGSNVDGVIIRNNTNVKGAVTTTGYINIGADLNVGANATIQRCLYIKDYYQSNSMATFWYNYNRDGYAPKALYIDTAQSLFVNRDKVLTDANSGIIREKLYEGVLSRGATVTFSKSIKAFDAIEVLSGDTFFSSSGSSGKPSNIKTSDVISNTYNPNLLLSPYPFFQINYTDTQGGTSGNSKQYASVMRMLSETQMKLIQVYVGNNIYSDGDAHLAIYGIKYSFGGKQ